MQKQFLFVCATVLATSIPALAQQSTLQIDASNSGLPAGVAAAPVSPAEAEDVVAASDLEQSLSDLETAHAQNFSALQSVLDKVPANVRPTIEQAMENSRKGWQRAKDNRDRLSAHRDTKRQDRMSRGRSGRSMAPGQQGRPDMAGQHGRPESTLRGQGNASQNAPGFRSADTRNDPAGQLGSGQFGSPESLGSGSANGRPASSANKRK